jgi:hypothetical protein
MNFAENFTFFWNRLASRNQKIKFRNSREAAEFIRHLARTKPNREVMNMREKYVAVQAERRAAQQSSESRAGEHRAIRQYSARSESVRLRRETA